MCWVISTQTTWHPKQWIVYSSETYPLNLLRCYSSTGLLIVLWSALFLGCVVRHSFCQNVRLFQAFTLRTLKWTNADGGIVATRICQFVLFNHVTQVTKCRQFWWEFITTTLNTNLYSLEHTFKNEKKSYVNFIIEQWHSGIEWRIPTFQLLFSNGQERMPLFETL